MKIQERLQIIMRMNNLNASQFADKIGVQRSSISHIISGRNKPSLDFLQKTLEHFPRVNADWLITGKVKNNDLQNDVTKVNDNVNSETSTEERIDVKSQRDEDSVIQSNKESRLENPILEKIVWFYSDGSYRVFENKQL
jgi:transcriptional regulator with XRE-family HTH domain